MCLAVPGEVVSIELNAQGTLLGKVSFGGVLREVCLALVPEVQPGQYVIVHAGVALSLLDEREAQETLDLLRALGEVEPEPQAGDGDEVR